MDTNQQKAKRLTNRKYYAKTRKVNHDEIFCPICHVKFIPNRLTKKTCSDKCRKALSRQNKLLREQEKAKKINGYDSSQWVIG